MGVSRLRCGPFELSLSEPVVMGVLNITPDSFSDGGLHFDFGRAVDAAHRMVEEGAGIIDLGGESTRPGAPPVPVDEERSRVIPVLSRLAKELNVPLSVDTRKPELMAEAIGEGAAIINDVTALQASGAVETIAAGGVAACLMHMQGEPQNMQKEPQYTDVVNEVFGFLRRRVAECVDAGLEMDRLLVDPGFGFGKTVAHNLALLEDLEELSGIGPGVLVGLSRKSMIGSITGRPVEDRLPGSIVLAVMAAERGARVIRAHDVGATVDALKLVTALAEQRERH